MPSELTDRKLGEELMPLLTNPESWVRSEDFSVVLESWRVWLGALKA